MASFDQLLKNSPVGNRSPQVTRQDYSGTLKTTISLGKTPTIVQKGPFYLCKDLPGIVFIHNYLFSAHLILVLPRANVIIMIIIMVTNLFHFLTYF